MINTFNLEQNLLTFPSERDILTGGRGGVSAMEDGWLDGRPLTCPRVSVHAAALPAPRPGHTGRVQLEKPSLATPDAQRAEGTYDPVDSLLHQGQWEALFHRPLSFWSISGRKWQDIQSQTSEKQQLEPTSVKGCKQGGA